MAKLPEFFHFQVLGGLTKIEIQDVSDKDFVEVVRCRDCKFWKTGIAYDAVGVCKHDDHPWNQITNRNYYCADGREKE